MGKNLRVLGIDRGHVMGSSSFQLSASEADYQRVNPTAHTN
jgi:hypothetical protein